MLYEKVDCKYNKFWVPLMWANSVLSHARKEGNIKTDWGLRMVIEVTGNGFRVVFSSCSDQHDFMLHIYFYLQAIADFRDRCSLCFVYDWITIPLVYTQVNKETCPPILMASR